MNKQTIVLRPLLDYDRIRYTTIGARTRGTSTVAKQSTEEAGKEIIECEFKMYRKTGIFIVFSIVQ